MFAACTKSGVCIFNTPLNSKSNTSYRLSENVDTSCADWNHNGQVLATCGRDSKIRLTYLSSRKIIATLSSDDNSPINSLSFSIGSRFLVSGGDDGYVKLWDLKKQKRVLQFKNHGFGIRALAVGPNLHAKSSEDDLIVVSGDDRGAVMVWTLNDGEVLTCLLEDTDDGEERNAVNAIDISPDGTTVIIATEDRTIRVFDLRSQKLLASAVLESVDEEITNLSICGNGGVFAAAHEDRLDLWTVDWILKAKGTRFGVRTTSSRKFISGKNK